MKKIAKSNLLVRATLCAASSALIALPVVSITTDSAVAQPRINRNYTRGTMNATVTRDLGGDRFEVRADDNRIFTVRSRDGEPRRLRVGDRVLLQGYINDRNIFVAENVTRIRNGGVGGGYGNIDFYGTVVNVAASNRVIVRADDGRNFTVSSRYGLSRSINRGDRVRVTGISGAGNTVRSASVALVSNSGGIPGNGTITVSGTVLSSNRAGRSFELRGSDGRNYSVRPNNMSTFRRGERVRVVGTYRNGRINATSISRY